MAILPTGQFHMLVGASGSGKTTLSLQAWKEHERKPGNFPISFEPNISSAAIIIADRTKSEAEERAKYLGINDLTIYGIVDDHTLSTKLINQPDVLFKEILQRVGHKDLYILDPIALFMEGSLIDYKAVAKSLITFNRFASLTQATFVGVHHTTKARTDFSFKRTQDRVSGSGAFPGYSSTQIMLIEGKESDSEWDSLVIIPHMTKEEHYRLMRKEDGYFVTLEEHSKGIVSSIIASLTKKFMKISEFKSLAARNGLTDDQIDEWLNTRHGLRIDGDFVLADSHK